MTAGVGKLESKIVIPAGGWSFDLTDSSGGPFTISFTAGDEYYLSSAGSGANSFLADMEAKMEAASANGYTVRVFDVSGHVQVAVSTGTFTLTWTDTDLRDMLGYTGTIGPISGLTAPNQTRSIWVPGAPSFPEFGLNSSGLVVSNAMVRIAPDGTYTAFHGPSRTRNLLRWPVVQVNKVIQAEETDTNESFEKFWLDTVRGEASWSQAGRLRWYPDETVDGTSFTYAVTDAVSPQYERVDPTYDGLWAVSLSVSEVT